ncbi:MAG TPA: Lrp/AsnC family transcriptional regulator [Rhizomicrobium sp.]|nr:Lrp/AsnC family transcriptional regulator [Rhizomicrobium sp.]
MDDLDRNLISLLRSDGRESAAALAKKLKVSRGTVQNRITNMLDRGEIQGFTVRTRPQADGNQVRAVMCVAIEGERSSKVTRTLRGFPEVDKIHTTNGRWDLVVELETETLGGFSAILDQIRTIEGIASTETSLLLATLKT